MKVFLSVISSCLLVFTVVSLQTSKLPDHSVFYIKGNSLYETLKKDGSFKNAIIFKLVDNISSIKNRIPTGEYILSKNDNSFTFLRKLIENIHVTRKITFPEGITVYEIVEKLNKNPLLSGTIKELPPEGSLMPNTYFYKLGNSKKDILNRMKDQMDLMKKEIKKYNKTNLNTNEIIILASIIEKEVHKPADRKLVSSVYHNRLKKKMRLQSDPTIIYALTKNNVYTGQIDKVNITNKDLFKISPYNTYRKAGLPPTPICCPSKSSIIAAMNPANTNYLFFISDIKNNKVYYSSDFKQHVRYKNKIRKKNNNK